MAFRFALSPPFSPFPLRLKACTQMQTLLHIGEYKTPNPGGLADDGLPFGSSAHLPQFQRPQFRRPLGDSDPGAARKDPKEWVEDMGEDRSAYQKYIPASAERRTSLVAGQGEHDEEVDEPESEVLELEEDERVRCEILSL